MTDTTGIPVARVYSAALEEGGEDLMERAFRFIGGVLTSAFGGRGQDVIGESVVVRQQDDESALLRIDVPDMASGEQLLGLVQADLDTMTADDFSQSWLHGEHEGRHVALGSADGKDVE